MSIKQHMADHLAALRRGDIEALLAHYNDQSVLIHQQGIANGLIEIRGLLEFFITSVIPPDSTELNLDLQLINDQVAYITWSATSDLFTIDFATDTMIFNGDIIAVQTTAGVMTPKAKPL